MCAVLNGHTHPRPDWTCVGSKVNAVTGSRRAETYNTTLIGTTKLLENYFEDQLELNDEVKAKLDQPRPEMAAGQYRTRRP